jgi:hypothetical protein
METTAEQKIDWRTAVVQGDTLTVELESDIEKGWPKRFRGVLALLEHGDRWGKITLHKSTIKVADVQVGSEEELRHLLEGIVLQVNTDFDPSGSEHEAGEPDPERERDERMTDLFRGFAEPSEVA